MESRERLLAAIESTIQRDDARAMAIARGQGLAAPSKPAPTSVQCRAALELR